MSNYNRVTLVGRLSADPILSYTPAGKPVCKFALAINNKYTNKAGDKVEDVDFIPITVWDKQAENSAEWLSKGKLALVEGRLRQEKWTDKEGKKRSSISVTANLIRFLSPLPKQDATNRVADSQGRTQTHTQAHKQAQDHAQVDDHAPAQDHAPEQNLPEDQADEHCPF